MRGPTKDLELDSKALGAMPIVNRFLDKLHLEAFFEHYLPHKDPRSKLPASLGLGLVLRNLIVAREPLYNLSEWATQFDEALLGLRPGDSHLLTDDRIGRCLDQLFLADRAVLLTDIVVHAIKTFGLEMQEFHNDSTTITFSGRYRNGDGRPYKGRTTRRIVHGANKDHRFDLRQLLWVLTTTADGGVPIWCSVEHGNTEDSSTHIDTWNLIRQLVGSSDFLYVADSKLCTKKNMAHIQQQRGRFITILPKTRVEDRQFRDWLQTNKVSWTPLLCRKNVRQQDGPDEIYKGFESTETSAEGYRIMWIWSSQKATLDAEARENRMERGIEGLRNLARRLLGPRPRMKSVARVEAAATKILEETNAVRWLSFEVVQEEVQRFKQAKPGRPGKETPYKRLTSSRPVLRWKPQADAVQYDTLTDGIFPLILNDKTMSMKEALLAYKYQPTVEKRHEQLKTVLQVRPVLLKSPARIEAFLFMIFLALLAQTLIERELRRQMKTEKIDSLPLYPESRSCKQPTADRVFQLLELIRRHRLVGADGSLKKSFYDPLSSTQRTVLRLLGLSPSAYFGDGDQREGHRG